MIFQNKLITKVLSFVLIFSSFIYVKTVFACGGVSVSKALALGATVTVAVAVIGGFTPQSLIAGVIAGAAVAAVAVAIPASIEALESSLNGFDQM
jgi:hypothetical protein